MSVRDPEEFDATELLATAMGVAMVAGGALVVVGTVGFVDRLLGIGTFAFANGVFAVGMGLGAARTGLLAEYRNAAGHLVGAVALSAIAVAPAGSPLALVGLVGVFAAGVYLISAATDATGLRELVGS